MPDIPLNFPMIRFNETRSVGITNFDYTVIGTLDIPAGAYDANLHLEFDAFDWTPLQVRIWNYEMGLAEMVTDELMVSPYDHNPQILNLTQNTQLEIQARVPHGVYKTLHCVRFSLTERESSPFPMWPLVPTKEASEPKPWYERLGEDDFDA